MGTNWRRTGFTRRWDEAGVSFRARARGCGYARASFNELRTPRCAWLTHEARFTSERIKKKKKNGCGRYGGGLP